MAKGRHGQGAPARRRYRELLDELAAQQEALDAQPVRAKHPRELIVIVWKNHVRAGNFGHAALKIRNDGMKAYASWWPGEGAGLGDAFRGQAGERGDYLSDRTDEIAESTNRRLLAGQFAPRDGQRLLRVNDRNNSTAFDYGQQPTQKVYLPGAGVAGKPFGLIVSPVYNWWTIKFVHEGDDRTYQLASRTRSCAGVVREALKRGGAKAFVDAPESSGWATPAEILNWAISLDAKLTDLNMRYQRLKMQVQMQVGARHQLLYREGYGDLPSVDLWRRDSRRPNGTRGDNVRSIDQHLGRYYRHRAQPLDEYDGLVKQLKSARKIFEIAESAVQRNRHAHDAMALKSIALRVGQVLERRFA